MDKGLGEGEEEAVETLPLGDEGAEEATVLSRSPIIFSSPSKLEIRVDAAAGERYFLVALSLLYSSEEGEGRRGFRTMFSLIQLAPTVHFYHVLEKPSAVTVVQKGRWWWMFFDLQKELILNIEGQMFHLRTV